MLVNEPNPSFSIKNLQVAGSNFPGHYPGETNGWNLEAFKLTLIVTINSLNSNEIEFDLVGVDASVANALRRIVISEVISFLQPQPNLSTNNKKVFSSIDFSQTRQQHLLLFS